MLIQASSRYARCVCCTTALQLAVTTPGSHLNHSRRKAPKSPNRKPLVRRKLQSRDGCSLGCSAIGIQLTHDSGSFRSGPHVRFGVDCYAMPTRLRHQENHQNNARQELRRLITDASAQSEGSVLGCTLHTALMVQRIPQQNSMTSSSLAQAALISPYFGEILSQILVENVCSAMCRLS